jgi:O-methyltransferase
MIRILKKIINYFGVDIVKYISPAHSISRKLNKNLNFGYEFEGEALEAIQIVKHNTMLTYNRLVTLYQQVLYCEEMKIEGDFVECGVWKGGGIGLMALANLKHSKERRILHLFDAFDDICQPNEEHDEKKLVDEVKAILKTKGEFDKELKPLAGIYDQFGGAGSLAENKDLIESKISYPKDFVNYHKGWFQETIPQIDNKQISKIAILRLDGDWYESTKVCLDYLYPKVVKGGVIIIDDYHYNVGCKKAVDEYTIKNDIKNFKSYVDGCCIYWIKID